MSQTATLTTDEERQLKNIATHLIADGIAEWDGQIQSEVIVKELETAIPETDAEVDLQSSELRNIVIGEITPDITVDTPRGEHPLPYAFEHGLDITGVTHDGGRPSGLPPLGRLTSGDRSAAKATSDFTILDSITRERSDILAEHGFLTWESISKADRAELVDLPMLGKATVDDLIAEAKTRADVGTVIARESLIRVQNISTDSDGTGQTVDLNNIKQTPGDPVDNPEKNNWHGWHKLKESDHPLIPDDPGPVIDQETELGVTEFELTGTLLSKGRNVMYIGPPGCGKNVRLRKAFHETNRPLLTIPMDKDTMIQELMGDFKIDGDTIVFEEKAFPTMVEYGGGVCIDEPNAAPSSVLRALYKILEDDAKIYVRGADKIIYPHPEFYLVSTINPADLGAGQLPGSFARRFNKIPISSLSVEQEKTLLQKRVNAERTIVKDADIESLVEAANNLRDRAREDHGLPWISTGELENICHAADSVEPNNGQPAVINAFLMEARGKQLATIGQQSTGNIFDMDALDDLVRTV